MTWIAMNYIYIFCTDTYIVIEWCIVALYIILHRSPEPPLLRLVTMNCYESVIWPSSPIVQTPSNQNCRTFHPDKFIRFCWMMSIFRTNLVLAASKILVNFQDLSEVVLEQYIFFNCSSEQANSKFHWGCSEAGLVAALDGTRAILEMAQLQRLVLRSAFFWGGWVGQRTIDRLPWRKITVTVNAQYLYVFKCICQGFVRSLDHGSLIPVPGRFSWTMKLKGFAKHFSGWFELPMDIPT